MARELEIRPVEGRSYSTINILEDGRPVFAGVIDFSPNGHFGLASGKQIDRGVSIVIFFIDQRILWARDAVAADFVHVTDHGIAAYLDVRDLAIADMNGEVLRKAFGPPYVIDAFKVGSDGFYISAGRTRWRADYAGNLERIDDVG